MGFLFVDGFTLMFLLVFGLIIFTIVRGIGEWSKNNRSPRLTVEAAVVSKRARTTQHPISGDAGGAHGFHTSTSYYVTFQVESGDRMELHLSGQEYGLLVEGDRGKLTFQGTRYLGFKRAL